jgi:hypothetical protein
MYSGNPLMLLYGVTVTVLIWQDRGFLARNGRRKRNEVTVENINV